MWRALRGWGAGALQAVRGLAEAMSAELGMEVYTFSVFHVFFEQYLTIASTSLHILGAPFPPPRVLAPSCQLYCTCLWFRERTCSPAVDACI